MSKAQSVAFPRRNMPALTLMRAVLAWWVVAFHVAPLHPFAISQQTPFLSAGVIRVDCFFVISGFVLYNADPFLFGRNRTGAFHNFLIARFARVYPLHFLMLLAFVLLVVTMRVLGIHLNNDSAFTFWTLVHQLLLLHGSVFPNHTSWNYPSWSVGAEAVAYLAAPLVFLLVSRISPAMVLPVAILCGSLVVGLIEAHLLTRPAMTAFRVLSEFGLGSLLCRVAQEHHAPMLRARRPALLVGLAAVGGLALVPHHGAFFAALLWMIVFLSLRDMPHTGVLGRLEAVGLFFGETAFAVYICHAFLLTLWAGASSRLNAGVFNHPVPAAIVLFVAIQVTATSLNRYVEVPSRRLIRRRLQIKRRDAGGALAAIPIASAVKVEPGQVC